ncbi:hypothetical protein V8D89_004239 [Ganoderma adspersum]
MPEADIPLDPYQQRASYLIISADLVYEKVWEEEQPQKWGTYSIPDYLLADQCLWEGCKLNLSAGKKVEDYRVLKKHVETVHLGLRFVCRLCRVATHPDKFNMVAKHNRGCS